MYKSNRGPSENQKNFQEINKNIEILDNKLKTTITKFNETILNINSMFSEKDFNLKVINLHNYNSYKLVDFFGKTCSIYNNYLVFGNMLNNSVELYLKNGTDNFKRYDTIKFDNFKECGKYVAINDKFLLISGKKIVEVEADNNQINDENILTNNINTVNEIINELNKNRLKEKVEEKTEEKVEEKTEEKTEEKKEEKTEETKEKKIEEKIEENKRIEKRNIVIIYANANNKWKEDDIIELDYPEIDSLKLVNNKIYIEHQDGIDVYQKNDKWNKINVINEKNCQFDIFENNVAIVNNNILKILDTNTNKTENILEINGEDIYKIKLYSNLLIISGHKYIKIFEKKNGWKEKQIIYLSDSPQDFDIDIDGNSLMIMTRSDHSLISEELNVHIYKKDQSNSWNFIKKIAPIKKKFKKGNHFYSIKMLSNLTILNYVCDNSGEIHIINETSTQHEWKGEYISTMNKAEIIIVGELFSNNIRPKISIPLNNINLPRMKKNFYKNHIPSIQYNFYDIVENIYDNEIQISNIIFSKEKLEFYIDNIKKKPYNYLVNISISYLYE